MIQCALPVKECFPWGCVGFLRMVFKLFIFLSQNNYIAEICCGILGGVTKICTYSLLVYNYNSTHTLTKLVSNFTRIRPGLCRLFNVINELVSPSSARRRLRQWDRARRERQETRAGLDCRACRARWALRDCLACPDCPDNAACPATPV